MRKVNQSSYVWNLNKKRTKFYACTGEIQTNLLNSVHFFLLLKNTELK